MFKRLIGIMSYRFFIVKVLVGTFNKKKLRVGAFSRHCETSRRFVDSSSDRVGCDCVEMSIWHDNTINQGAVQTL